MEFQSPRHKNLHAYIYREPPPGYGDPDIPPALVETFLLLDNYNPGGMKYYESDRIVVWVFNSGFESEAIPWLLPVLPLKELITDKTTLNSTNPFIISIQELPDGEKEIPNGYYVEDGNYYHVISRPAWPYEIINENNRLVDLGPPASELVDPISCRVSDGLLPIPTPPP